MKRAGRIGRRIALGIYFVAITYMVVVGMHSVVRQVFWPTPPAAAQPIGSCDAELEALRAELLERASDHVARGGGDGGPPEWLAAWDARYLTVASRCDHPAMPLLQRLRYRIETTLRRFDREEARLSGRVRRLLDEETAAPRASDR